MATKLCITQSSYEYVSLKPRLGPERASVLNCVHVINK